MIKEHKIQLKTVKIESKPIMIYIASYENKEVRVNYLLPTGSRLRASPTVG